MSSFHNRQRAAQLIDFQGLKWGNLRPTDLDLSIDFQGRTWVFGELKGKWQDLTVGQRIHLEGLVKGLRKGGLTAYAVFARHDTPVHKDVIAYDAFDCKVFDGNTWTEVNNESLGDILGHIKTAHDMQEEYTP